MTTRRHFYAHPHGVDAGRNAKCVRCGKTQRAAVHLPPAGPDEVYVRVVDRKTGREVGINGEPYPADAP